MDFVLSKTQGWKSNLGAERKRKELRYKPEASPNIATTDYKSHSVRYNFKEVNYFS